MDTQMTIMLGLIGFSFASILVNRKIRMIFRNCIFQPNCECTLDFRREKVKEI